MITTADTSRAAHEINKPKAPAQRLEIVAHVRSQGRNGAICDECEIALGLPHQTASARFTELKASGALVQSGEIRPTRTGSPAAVFVTPEFQ